MLLKHWVDTDTLLIAFAGTASWQDMVTNGLAHQTKPLSSKQGGATDGTGHVAHTGISRKVARQPERCTPLRMTQHGAES